MHSLELTLIYNLKLTTVLSIKLYNQNPLQPTPIATVLSRIPLLSFMFFQ